jgi:hypothetical protein
MQPATQSQNQPFGPPLGGTNGDLRYRFFHFHIPLALVSIVVLLLWMSIPLIKVPQWQHKLLVITGHRPLERPHQCIKVRAIKARRNLMAQ